ncbi:hypothetical protein ACFQ4O_07470 [Methylopila musalis]|uniref:Uncharacterized protein n=1 Tax=Methylopila musalis TaxID=1134781 RepID=A0ABW3Z6F5_9HYPH
MRRIMMAGTPATGASSSAFSARHLAGDGRDSRRPGDLVVDALEIGLDLENLPLSLGRFVGRLGLVLGIALADLRDRVFDVGERMAYALHLHLGVAGRPSGLDALDQRVEAFGSDGEDALADLDREAFRKPLAGARLDP